MLNSHPVMMVGSTREFLELLQANEAGGFRRVLYFLTHLKAARIAAASGRTPPVTSTSPTGARRRICSAPAAVKYVVAAGVGREKPDAGDADRHLSRGRDAAAAAREEATFDFMVQFQTDARRTPIEDASVEWKEQDSPYLPVARIRIPAAVDRRCRQRARCEQVGVQPVALPARSIVRSAA